MSDIDDTIAGFAERPWVDGTWGQMIRLLHDGRAMDFVIAALTRIPDAGTFLHASLSFLTIDDLAAVVDVAIDRLRSSVPDTDDGAESVVDYAGIQAPQLLRPHLSELWELRAGWDVRPWRAADSNECARLVEVIDTSDDEALALRAWRALLETRSPEGFRLAREHPVDAAVHNPSMNSGEAAVAFYQEVGFEPRADELVRLVGEKTWHLGFTPQYFADQDEEPEWMRKADHPTWFGLGPPVGRASFGGSLAETACASCGQMLHRMVTLDPVPAGSLVTTRSKVTIATCLSCLVWEQDVLYFAHDPDGVPTPVGASERVTPQFPEHGLTETVVDLVPTPARWLVQDWGMSNGRENLNRLGGEPAWIQGALYPACPRCSTTMAFVFQLDSGLPNGEADFLWSSGGIGYFFWCDSCAISANQAQWT